MLFENKLEKSQDNSNPINNSNYVITLDRIRDISLIEEILSHANISKQIKEWQELGIVDDNFKISEVIEINLSGKHLSQKYKHLPIDTKYFKDLELKILGQFENLDEALDGWLIKSENYQALNTILPKFKGKIQTIYIDPPYNTGNNRFVYKDNFDRPSWLKLMKDRLQLAKEFLNESGIINISIGDTINSRNRTTSTAYLQILCNTIFGEDNYIATFVRKSQASPRHDIRHIANAHDYILTYAKNIKLAKINKKLADTSRLKYEDKYVNTRGKFDLNQLDRGSEKYSQSLDYSINIEKDEVIEFFDGTNFKKIKAPERIEIWPGRNPKDKKWIFTWSKEKVKWGIENGYIVFRKDKNGQWKVYYKGYELVDNCGKPRKRTIPYSTLILDYQNEFGTAEIQNFFGTKTFDYAKPSGLIKHILQITSNSESLILDFFAGSGTTAHAVIRLNKEDGGKRKFILIEMEDYFYTIIIPRIKKLSYSLNWKNGKPKTIDGIGIFFKYCELE